MLLEDSERVRAYVHPVRMHILSLLVDVPATVTQVANRLDVHPANITRHFRLLERVGLIELVEKRDTGRNLEKYYRAVARSFEVRIAPEQVEDARATALRVLRDDLSIAIGTVSGAGDEPAVGLLGTARLEGEFACRMAPPSLRDPVVGRHDLAVDRSEHGLPPAVALVCSHAEHCRASAGGRMEVPPITSIDPDQIVGEPLAELIGAVTRDGAAGRVVRPPLPSDRKVDGDGIDAVPHADPPG
jgi:DNA-binding transcriptional ArsR family regulator